MPKRSNCRVMWLAALLCSASLMASAQSFRVQCPTKTAMHQGLSTDQGGIECQQISGGDCFATMADGTQTYLFSFGPLSGLADIARGLPGTEPPSTFNSVYGGTLQPGDPATTDGAS